MANFRKKEIGTDLTTKQMSNLLPQIVGQIGGKCSHDLFLAWPQIIGEKLAPFTEVISVDSGVVTIKVKSSTLYSVLCQQEKTQLLKKLRKQFPKTLIRDLIFRIG